MTSPSAQALPVYERLAPSYDDFSADYDHPTWLSRLEHVAIDRGLRGRRLLDVGCGTGKSFLPLLARGYRVTAFDLSPSMVEVARAKVPTGQARLFAADMTRLPDCGRFDLATCLDDAVNYLLDASDLIGTFVGVRRALADDGLFIFDTNTLRTYRTTFAERNEFRRGRHLFTWSGQEAQDFASGGSAAAAVTVRAGCGPELKAIHRQRHHPVTVITACLHAAGLRLEAVLGQSTGCVVHASPDELLTTKTLYVARKQPAWRERERGGTMTIKP